MSFVTPVQHKIPASNDYKNVNITNFKGTSYSDNIFDGKTSGCSESENIYINEENILAVRPRLQHVSSLENIKDIKRVDILDENLMIYYVEDIYEKFWIIFSDKTNAGIQETDSKISLDSDLGKCSFFKDSDNKIFCVSETGFYEIIDRTSLKLINKDHPDVYVPTLRTGMVFGDMFSGTETGETANILTNTYHNQYNYSLDFKNSIPKDYVDNRKFDTSGVIEYTPDNETSIQRSDFAYDMHYDYYNTTIFDTKNMRSIILANNIEATKPDYYDYDVKPSLLTVKTWSNNEYITCFSDTYPSPEWVDPVDGASRHGLLATKQNVLFLTDRMLYATELIFYDDGTKITSLSILGQQALYDKWSKLNFDIQINITDSDELATSLLSKLSDVHPRDYRVILTAKNNKIYYSIFISTGYETYIVTVSKFLEDSKSLESKLYKIQSEHVFTVDDVIITDDSYGLYLISLANRRQDRPGYITYPSKFNILKTNFSDNIQLVFDTFVKVPSFESYGQYGLSLKMTNIDNDNILISICDTDIALQKHVNTVFNKLHKIESPESILISIFEKTYNHITDTDLDDAYIYKIPKTSSFISIKLDEQNVKYKFKLYTNYTGNSAGFEQESFNALLTLYDTSEDKEATLKFSTISVEDGYIRFHNLITERNSLNFDQSDYYYVNYVAKKIKITPNLDTKSITEIVTRDSYEKDYNNFKFTNHRILDNKIWLFGKGNKLRWSFKTSAFYFPEDYYTEIGVGDTITNILPLSTNSLGIFQKHKTTVLSEDDNGNYIFQKTIKTPKGCLGEDQAIVIPTTNYPLVINEDSVAMLTQSENGVVEDSVFTIISEDIFKKFAIIRDKENIKTHAHGYYIYFYWSEDDKSTDIWCLDCRTLSWFKWKLPIVAKFMYESDETTNLGVETETRIVTNTSEYCLTSMGILIDGNDDTIFNEDISAYVDELEHKTFRRIPWKWKSRIQTLGTVNYLKKITSLQLIFSDRQRYARKDYNGIFTKNNTIFYSIKTYRKKSELLNGFFSSTLDGVGIQRLKIRLPKCDFAEITLSNYEDGIINNNKLVNNYLIVEESTEDDKFLILDEGSITDIYDRLHLVGITLKILLSEGLNG